MACHILLFFRVSTSFLLKRKVLLETRFQISGVVLSPVIVAGIVTRSHSEWGTIDASALIEPRVASEN